MAIGTNAIPYELKADKEISANAKLIYLEISFCCKKFNVCNFSNNDFQKMLGISSNHTLISSLTSLQEKGWIEIEYSRKLGTTSERFIRLKKQQKNSQEVVQKMHQGSAKNALGVVQKMHQGSAKNAQPSSLFNKENKEINKENKEINKENKESGVVVYSSLSLTETELQKLFDEFWQIYPNEKKNLDEKSAFEKFIQIDLEKEYQYLMSFIQNLIDTNKSRYIPNLKSFFQKRPFTNHSQIDCLSDFKIDSILHPITQQQIDNLFEQLKL